jgi:membrane-bound lytic murein transglycosylase B
VLGFAALVALALAGGLGLPLPGGSGGHGAAPAVARDSLAPMAARREIPPAYLQLYMRIGREQDIDWRFLAAIGGQESDHGRNRAAYRVNASGCIGPMQLGVGGDCGDLLRLWGTDGDGDGRIDPREPADAIATAARGLRQGMGAPATGGSWLEYYRAACAYYGACADGRANYGEDVMRRAERYGFPPAGG